MNVPGMRMTTAMVAVSMFAGAGTLQAHHSLSMFDTSNPIWIRGTVVSYEAINPHTMITLEETTADGKRQRWTIEGPFPGRLSRILEQSGLPEGTVFVAPGAVIEVCGFDLREDLRARRAPRTADDPSPKFAHGHVLVMPDGHRQSWGPYGKMDNCVRPDDSAESWRQFLDTDLLARDLWCGGRRQINAISITPAPFLAAVGGSIENPCE